MVIGKNLVQFVCLALLVLLWCKPKEVIALEECKDIFASSTCKAQANSGGCKYTYTLKNCRKTCKNCTTPTTSPPTQATTTKVPTTIPRNSNLTTIPSIIINSTTITKHFYTNNNTYTHSGSLCRCAPTSLLAAVLLWILGCQVIGLVG